jgi:NADPH:quinone reductase-like Zn-dependent oxidoreductase
VVQSLGVGKIVTDHPVPSLRPDHMLVKVRAVALNPTDWKHLDLNRVQVVSVASSLLAWWSRCRKGMC